MGLAAAPLIITAISTAYAIHTKRQAANYEYDVAKRNQSIASNAATDAIQRGQIEEAAVRQRTNQIAGSQRVAYGASGVGIGSGSPLAVLGDTAALGEVDALTVRNNAAREAYGFKTQAQNFESEAGMANKKKNIQTVGTLLGAASGKYGSWGKKK